MSTQKTSLKRTPFSGNDDIQLLKESVDLHVLLSSLGFKITIENSKEIRCACRIHGGDNRSAFRLNKQTRTWVCFTHSCHTDYKRDLLGLVQAVLSCDFMTALNYIKELVGDDLVNSKYLAARKFNTDRDSFIKRFGSVSKPEYVNEASLRSYLPLRSQTFNRDGFKNSTLDEFEVAGGFRDKHNVPRDIIPIRGVNNELLAFSLRDIRKNPPDESFKYLLTEGFIKDHTLYNLNNAKVYCNKYPLILVEGFKSVWRLYEYGIYNVVAIIGARLTEGQIELLKTYALKGVVIFFDCDIPGLEGMVYAERDLKQKGIPYNIVTISLDDVEEEGDGPAELTKSQVYRYLYGYIG